MAITEQVLKALRDNREKNNDEGWDDVYLDNAKPSGMSQNQFRACLATLSKQGLYKVVDGYAWGSVKLN